MYCSENSKNTLRLLKVNLCLLPFPCVGMRRTRDQGVVTRELFLRHGVFAEVFYRVDRESSGIKNAKEKIWCKC